MSLAGAVLGTILGLVGVRRPAWAQEVIVDEPQAMPGYEEVDVLPRPKGKFAPSYPREMKKSEEIVYVAVTRYIDATGKSRSLRVESSAHPCREAVESALKDLRFEPAQADGKPVAVEYWQAVIFNPASSAADRAEATPRLLHATPILFPPPENSSKKFFVNGVSVTLVLDAAGQVTAVAVAAVQPATERWLPVIKSALKGWRFAPARRGGQPVAAEIRLVLVLQQLSVLPLPRGTPPVPLKQMAPKYPERLGRSGLRGEVVVKMVIDKNGDVRDAVVDTSNNPEFNDAALATVRQWKYKPAEVDGRPVNTRVQQKITFEVPGGQDAFAVDKPDRTAMEKLPPEYRYDVAPVPRGVVVPVYPYELLRDGISGTAEAKFVVYPNGYVASVTVVETSRPEFGLALEAALEGFAFDPALKDGKPVLCVLRMKHEFSVSEDHRARALIKREKERPETIVSGHALDKPLNPLSRIPPRPPLGGTHDTGEVMVEFLVDDDGKVRLPRIVKTDDPAMGYAVVQAVSAWEFEPPKSGGKPAVVRVQMPFEFK